MPAEGFKIASAYVEVVPDLTGFGEKLQAAINAETAGDKGTVHVGVELDDAAAIAGLAGLTSGATAASAALNDAAGAAAKLAAASAAVNALGRAGGGGGFFSWLRNIHIPLFGGAFSKAPAFIAAASGIHLLTDATIEFLGVVVPASIALAAFGVAAIPNLQDIYGQLTNINVISQATGRNIYPLTGGFQAMADAVKPEVYQLFGDALVIAGHQTGVFTTLATSAGTVLDQLGARFVVAITQGRGFSGFLHNASSDLSGIGTVIGNVGGIFGNFSRWSPGTRRICCGWPGRQRTWWKFSLARGLCRAS
jgi:hypothetical protein